MKSTLVEFARFKHLGTGILRKGDEYLRTVIDHPVQQVCMSIDQLPFNNLMHELRYENDAEESRIDALSTLSELVTNLLQRHNDHKDITVLLEELNKKYQDDPVALSKQVMELLQQHDNGNRLVDGPLLKEIKKGCNALQQIDLIANATELSALPFEAALSDDGTPLFRSGKGVVLTRRVRGDFNESPAHWPVTPRVLFVWSAAGGEVPYKEHREVLLEALKPWLPPDDLESVFVEIGNAKRRQIEQATRDGGFTHFHLLAHGQRLNQESDKRFGIALNHPIEGADVVTPEQLSETLTGIRSSAVVVTLAACDAGNQTDVINPEKSLAHILHTSGFPVVVASQLPLTMNGSNILVQRFYDDLFEGLDVREALHRTRVELYEKEEAGHGWVSLVGYVQLPEGYTYFLEAVRLKSHLSSLMNLRDRAEALAETGASRDDFFAIGSDLKRQINTLNNLLLQTKNKKALDESRGLLGSAEKRLAELLFRHLGDETSKQASRQAMDRACNWYRQAFDANPSHHWSGVQYLALHAALTGEVDSQKWKTAYRAAEVDRIRLTEYWAQGSLAELALLSQLIGEPTDETAEFYLLEMKGRFEHVTSTKPNADKPFQSTELQLRRYIDWWLPVNGFFPGAPDLAQQARKLVELIVE
ncbi:MAG: CHAT domain-containing protein [Candidatus Thiodiazotropha sp. (ex Rostrolucina anterorostrata)]|nr:CHAT domain-containing protein [Candidatus Thiodiazotropha sp. (ex Rostrolucina anterorostrata)]